jgi:hypothetical protein
MTKIDLRDEARAIASNLPLSKTHPRMREMALATWRGRMTQEHTSSSVFVCLAKQIEEADLGDSLAAECRSFADEERRHGVMCGAVVEALGGEAIFERPKVAEFPAHGDVSRREAVLRNVISIGCMSETVAVALIGAERLEMPEGALRDLLTRIYADEIGHAQFGWRIAALLSPHIDAAARARALAYIRVALAHLEAHELAHINVNAAPPKSGASLGLCNGRDARDLFYATVSDVIVPGLVTLGFAADVAWDAMRSDYGSLTSSKIARA